MTALPEALYGRFSRHRTQDALGSVRMITDASGAVVARLEYGAWGEEIFVSAIPALENFPYRFVGSRGCRADAAVGLIYMRNRWYDPSVQRFISRDPIGLSGGANLYSYAENNPCSLTDPFGLDTWEGTLTAIGGMAGVIGGQVQWGELTNQQTGEKCRVKIECWIVGFGGNVGGGWSNLSLPNGPHSGSSLDYRNSGGSREDFAAGLSIRLPMMPLGVGGSLNSNGGSGEGVSRGALSARVTKNMSIGGWVGFRDCKWTVLECEKPCENKPKPSPPSPPPRRLPVPPTILPPISPTFFL